MIDTISLLVAGSLARALSGCETGGYRVVYGPATLTVSGTAISPGLSVTIDEDGVAWFGPKAPDPDTLGYLEPESVRRVAETP